VTKIAVPGGELSYEVGGSGPPLVLIHGLGGAKGVWSRLRPPLEDRFTVVAYDLRGAGETLDATPDGRLSLDVWSDDLRALVDALELGRPAFVGHSLGSSIALKFTLRWPDDVAALVLMGADPELSRLAPRMQKVVELIEGVGLREWVANYWSTNTPFSTASLERSPEILDEYRAMLLRNDERDYVRTCRAIASSEDQTAELARVARPVLVIAGSDDDRTLPAAGRALAAGLPRASFEELPGVGHTMPLEAPEAVSAAVFDFLRTAGYVSLSE
jgi:pimeloyl-ACP methyl ester carboxylesterase